MEDIIVRPIGSDEFGYVGAMLARIFADNAVYSQIFAPEKAIAGLSWLFSRTLRLNRKYGRVYVLARAGDPGRPIGTFSLMPPDAKSPTMLDYVRLGILAMPFRFGMGALKRMMYLMKENGATIAEQLPDKDWWYLGMVVVGKEFRRRGIAAGVLNDVLRTISSPKKIALTTQLEANVCFYEKLGFRVLAHNKMGYKTKDILNWVMCFDEK